MGSFEVPASTAGQPRTDVGWVSPPAPVTMENVGSTGSEPRGGSRGKGGNAGKGGGTRSAAALSHGLGAYHPAWEPGNSVQSSAWCSELMNEPVSREAPLWPGAPANGAKLGA